MEMSAFDDAAMTVMHECGHLLKQHSHMDRAEALRNETEAESLMVDAFVEALHEGRNLDPQSLQTRLAFRSLQSLLWSGQQEIEKINDPLGSDEGFSHAMSAGLSLTDSPLTHEQATALLRAPVQVNALTYWLAGDVVQDRCHYFSALAALHAKGAFGGNTLAAVYVDQALHACRSHKQEWLDEALITNFENQLTQVVLPHIQWDDANDFFQLQQKRHVAPIIGTF